MTFDQSVLLWCGVVPAAVLLAVLVFARLLKWRCGQSSVCERWLAALTAIGWCLAVWVAVSGRLGWQWYPEEFWRRLFLPLLGWGIWTACRDADSERGWPWVLAGMLAVAFAWTVMPSGEAWQDTFSVQSSWLAAVAISCLLNSWSIDRMIRHGAERWVTLVSLAALGGPTILAASTYASLAECGLAAIAASLVGALVMLSGRFSPGSSAAFPPVILAAGLAATASFYSYEDHPKTIYAVMLLLPTLVAVADWPLCERNQWLRVSIAAFISAAIVASCAWFLLLRETESW